MKKYSDYNIIPLGDHCAISIILKELNLRNKSYPFDWVSHIDELYNTNIIYNIELINQIKLENNMDNIDIIIKRYIFLYLYYIDNKKVNQDNIWFPHESENMTENFEKYKRRFYRLKEDLNKKNIFIFCTRFFYIEKEKFEKIMNQLLSYNSESIILFISGRNHTYFENINNNRVIFKYIEYDISQFYHYDYISFRPNIKCFLEEFLL